jgi:hypothetical protein
MDLPNTGPPGMDPWVGQPGRPTRIVGQPVGVSNVTTDIGENAIMAALRNERMYAMVGLTLGGIALIAGIVMIFLNISGQVDLTMSSTKVNTAVVGIPVAVIGALIIFATRYKFTARNK